MLNLTIQNITGQDYYIFLYDDVLQIGAKDLMENPTAYEQVCDTHGVDLYLSKIEGVIGTKSINQFLFLIGARDSCESSSLNNIESFSNIIQLPEVARNSLIASYDSYTSNLFKNIIDSFEYCSNISTNTTCYLPEESLSYLDEADKQAFINSKKFNVNNFDMGSFLVQKNPTSEFSFILPSYTDVNTDPIDSVSIEELVRVSSPYRIQERSNSKYDYNAKVHTPYWHNDISNKFINDKFPWLNGYSKNNLLPLQDNEVALYKRLMDYIRGYTQMFLSNMLVGIYLSSPNGVLVRKLLNCKVENKEQLSDIVPVMKELITELLTTIPNGLVCNFNINAVDSYEVSDFSLGGKFHTDLGNSFTVTSNFFKELIQDHIAASRPRKVDITKYGFSLNISDEIKNEILPILIDNGFIGRPCYNYLYRLCEVAYAVHWGHNGIAIAIPALIDKTQSNLTSYSEKISDMLNKVLLGISSKDKQHSYQDDFDSFDLDDSDDAYISYNHYLGESNIRLIESEGTVDTSKVIANADDRIIERYRLLGCIDYLERFVYKAYSQVNDYGILVKTFIKLMRWGERKPQALVYPEYPEISDEFNLYDGIIVPNSHVFNEDDLILTNGCRYHLDSLFISESQIMKQSKPIVGFKLRQDYANERYRYFVASWLDIGEMAVKDKITVAEFLTAYDISYLLSTPNVIEEADSEYYISDDNISLGFEYNVKPEELNACVKMYRNVLDSREYIQATTTEHPIGLQDKQYLLLKRYIEALRIVYNNNEEKLKSLYTTIDILAIAREVYNVYNEVGKVVDHNHATASNTLSKLNIGGSSEQSYKYSDTKLEGKFILLNDSTCETNLNVILLTDQRLADLISKSKKRIVALLLEQTDCYLLCSKDITITEVKTKTNKDGKNVVHMIEAKKIFEQYNGILKGKVSFQGKPIKIHKSLKDIQI